VINLKQSQKTYNRYGKGMYGRGGKGLTKKIRNRVLQELEPTPALREAMRQTEEIIADWKKYWEEHSVD
jgi:hypothetical protein